VLLLQEIEEAQIIKQWLRGRRSGETVELSVPRQGTPHELVQMATENAVETLNALKARWQADTNRQSEALGELHQALELPAPPNRIECYDISNTQGTAAVGSMVVFEQGVPNKSLYRRFNIQNVDGPDDFASMEEVLTRRQARPGFRALARSVDRGWGQRPVEPGCQRAGALRAYRKGACRRAGQAGGRTVSPPPAGTPATAAPLPGALPGAAHPG